MSCGCSSVQGDEQGFHLNPPIALMLGVWQPPRSKKVIVQRFPGAMHSGSLSVAVTGSEWDPRAELLEYKGKGHRGQDWS